MATKATSEAWVLASKKHLDELFEAENNRATFFAVFAVVSALLAIATAILEASKEKRR